MPSPQRFALNPADPGTTANVGTARAVAVDASGNTFVGMQSFGTNSISRVGVAKFDAAGAFAAGFSGSANPVVAGAPLPGLTSVGLSSGDTRGIRVSTDGTVVIAGHGRANQNADGRPRRFHSARFVANGTLDATYGGVPASGLAAGQLVNTIATADSQGRVVVMYPDDSALLVSSTHDAINTDARARQNKILLTKLLANGLPDPTFGTAGSLVVPRLNEAAAPVVGSMVSFFPRAAARNSIIGGPAEGKIVIAGECQTLRNVSTGTTDNDACVVRVNGTTGAIDTTFGPSGNGFVTGGIAGYNEVVFALRIHGATLGNGASDPNAGKIVAAVQASGATTALTVSIVLRLTEAGLDDTTFVTTPAPDNALAIPAGTAGVMSPRALRIDRDGKYVVSGLLNSGTNNAFVPYVARISNGAMDAAFGTGGVFSGVPAYYAGIGDAYAFNNALFSGGRILYGGRVNLALENARSTRTYVGALTASGAIDYSFGVDGWVVLDDAIGTQSSEPFFSMFVESGGRILVGSTRTADDVGKTSEMRVTRLNFDGSIDTSYGVAGSRSVTFEAAPTQSKADIIRQINTDSVGNLIAVGLTWDNVSDGRVPAAFKLVGEAITIDSSYREFLSFRDAAYQQQHVYTATNRSSSTVALNLLLAAGGSSKFTLDTTLCSSTQCAENGASANTLPAGVTTPCGATLAPAAQCYFMVSFRPTAAQPGSFRENLNVGDLTATLDGRTCYLDMDRDGNRTLVPAVEGMLMMRYLLGLRGAALIADIPWTTATPPTAAMVEARISRQLSELDIDGDTLTNGLTDGLMLVRMMFGYKGEQVTGGAINPLGTRNTWPAVQSHVRRVCGAAFSLK